MFHEYAVDVIFSVNLDVFKFNVFVLEFVSCKKNRVYQDHNLNLLGHVNNVYSVIYNTHNSLFHHKSQLIEFP